MARPLRLEFPDAVHHVMSRGIEGRRICADDTDRDIWFSILERAAERFGWKVFAFSLLDNHFHLFLRAPEGALAPGMRQLNGDYAGYFNRWHGRLGPLMQGRYKSVLVAFGKDEGQARRAYRQFMEDGLGRKLDNPVSRAAHGLVLGSDEFVKRVRKMLAGRRGHEEVPVLGRLGRGVDLAELVGRAAERLGADRSGWVPGRRMDDPARALCAYAVRKASGARIRDLAAALGYRSASAVGKACRRAEASARSGQARRKIEEPVNHVAGLR